LKKLLVTIIFSILIFSISNYAQQVFATPGNTEWEYTGEFRQGNFAGNFIITDPDGIKSVNREGGNILDGNCGQTFGFNPGIPLLPFNIIVVDCELDMDTTKWLIEDDPISETASATCIEGSCLVNVVGGKIIPIETTSILAAGAQHTAAWMIPVLVSVIGIGIVIARKF